MTAAPTPTPTSDGLTTAPLTGGGRRARADHTFRWLSIAAGVLVLAILVGIVVVPQTLYTSAVEHVKEFGTVKAIGGSNWDIYRILGEQALISAVVGFVLGGLISLAMRPLMLA